MSRLSFAFALSLTLLGCPPASQKKSPPPAACTAVGQNCEFAPGKLGSCVKKDDCSGDGCFVCQSQH